MTGFRVRHPLLWGVALLFVAAIIIAVVVIEIASGGDDRPRYAYPVRAFDDQGRQHLASGQTYQGYNSNPPTSGPHAPRAAPWGVSDEPVPKEVAVHNMEHGGVIVWYNCRAGPEPLDQADCQLLRDGLAALVKDAFDQGKLVLMTPYANMEHRIALTAWRHLDAFEEFDRTRAFDEARVVAFIASFERLFNPERF